MIFPKPIEIFCGTGGVGKTTMATSRAAFLASQNKKVLLITIDPAKRLRQLLKLENSRDGEVHSVEIDFQGETVQLNAILMHPRSTLLRSLDSEENRNKLKDNHIIKVLTKPYGGMNEIMAILEVQYRLDQKEYDCIILDTPPGKHFIDFLNSSEKINRFFDKTFIEIFQYIGNKAEESSSLSFSKKILTQIVSTGVNKLLSYLEIVTGNEFLEEFKDTITILYDRKDFFLKALKFQEFLKQKTLSNWYFVTSAEQHKIKDAVEIASSAHDFTHEDKFCLVNKCLGPYLLKWHPSDQSQVLSEMRTTMLERENKLKEGAQKQFNRVIDFPEVLEAEPQKQLETLINRWNETVGTS
jgi:anion-transporting  ArsA/GET3 family ATPase